ncbi:RICIN domain-containing protein [Kitasatospora sp. NPDC003701]
MHRPTRIISTARRLTALFATAAVSAGMLLATAPAAGATPTAQLGGPFPGFTCDSGYYHFNTINNLVLDASTGSTNPGQIIYWPWRDSENQLWQVCHTADTGGRVLHQFISKWDRGQWCMSIDKRAPLEAGDWFLIDRCDGSARQQFWLAASPVAGWFAMQAQNSGMWIATVDGTGTAQYPDRADLFSLQLS